MSALVRALSDGAVVWLTTEGMLAEVAHMLGHRSLARWESDREAALATCRRLARVLPALSGPRVGLPRCTDPDDQPFVDLAIAEGARWLVSRDRALLKLGRRMQAHGVRVLVPEDWHAPPPALGAR